MPAFILVGVASASASRLGELAEIEPDPLRAWPAERVPADHVAEDVDDVASDEGPSRDQPERHDAQHDGERAVGRVAGPDHERDDQHHEGDSHEGRVGRRPRPGSAVGVGVVRQPRQGREDHEDDRGHDRDVGGRALIDQVEDDRPEQEADRDVRRCGVEGMPEPAAVEQVLDGPDRSEQRRQPAMVEVAQRASPPVVDRHESREQMGHGSDTSPEEYPQPVHNVHKFGDKVAGSSHKFVDKPVVVLGPRTVHCVSPEGAGVNRQTTTRSDPRGGPGNRVRRS